MRIIEPKQLAERKQKKAHKPRRWPLVLVVLALCVGGWFVYDRKSEKKAESARSDPSQTSQTEVSAAVATPVGPKTLKTFTPDEFLKLANTIAYPNTREFVSPPTITDHAAADDYMRKLAEQRGYRLRGQPPDLLVKTADGYQLQQRALVAWESLQKAAAADGVKLEIISAFRSVNEQRELYAQQLALWDLYGSYITSGEADQALASVLSRAAPPGYSRHHTGFTLDLACPDELGVTFEESSCFTWLSADNYRHVKEHGWIPSYPPGVTGQGPEPEAWEYVWVGEIFVTE